MSRKNIQFLFAIGMLASHFMEKCPTISTETQLHEAKPDTKLEIYSSNMLKEIKNPKRMMSVN